MTRLDSDIKSHEIQHIKLWDFEIQRAYETSLTQHTSPTSLPRLLFADRHFHFFAKNVPQHETKCMTRFLLRTNPLRSEMPLQRTKWAAVENQLGQSKAHHSVMRRLSQRATPNLGAKEAARPNSKFSKSVFKHFGKLFQFEVFFLNYSSFPMISISPSNCPSPISDAVVNTAWLPLLKPFITGLKA